MVGTKRMVDFSTFLMQVRSPIPPHVQLFAFCTFRLLNWINVTFHPECFIIILFAILDGISPTQLEWNMKLWWPHNEAMIAFLMAYKNTGNPKHLESFDKIFEYSYKHVRILHTTHSTIVHISYNIRLATFT